MKCVQVGFCRLPRIRNEHESNPLREKLASAASIPEDVVSGAALVTISGNNEIYIENYMGLLEYTDCLIRIRTKGRQIRICGKHLNIEYYSNIEMKITGRICSLEFCL